MQNGPPATNSVLDDGAILPSICATSMGMGFPITVIMAILPRATAAGGLMFRGNFNPRLPWRWRDRETIESK